MENFLTHRILFLLAGLAYLVQTSKILKKLFDRLFSYIGSLSYHETYTEGNRETSVVKQVSLGRNASWDDNVAIMGSRVVSYIFQ